MTPAATLRAPLVDPFLGDGVAQLALARDALGADLGRKLRDQGVVVRPSGRPRVTYDETHKWEVVSASSKRPVAFVLLSPAVDSTAVARAVDSAERARACAGPELGRVIVSPLATGRAAGLAWAAFPFHEPVNAPSRAVRVYRRAWHGWQALRWLADLTAHTSRPVAPADEGSRVRVPLERVAHDERLSPGVRLRAKTALARLAARTWRPRTVLAHNDLWLGNLLLASPSHRTGFGFVVIDWAGFDPHGHAFFDLVRLFESLRMPTPLFSREVRRHAALLGCEPEDAYGSLAAAAGALGGNLGHFPVARYVDMVERCFRVLARALP